MRNKRAPGYWSGFGTVTTTPPQHARALRVLFAALSSEASGPIVEAETLVVAELFCGSFCGWSQAAYSFTAWADPCTLRFS